MRSFAEEPAPWLHCDDAAIRLRYEGWAQVGHTTTSSITTDIRNDCKCLSQIVACCELTLTKAASKGPHRNLPAGSKRKLNSHLIRAAGSTDRLRLSTTAVVVALYLQLPRSFSPTNL